MKYYFNLLLAKAQTENGHIIDFYNFKIRIQSQFKELNSFLFLAYFFNRITHKDALLFVKIELFSILKNICREDLKKAKYAFILQWQ